ncbi:uncharacterized oxidoreductase dhs-27-like [Uranotaenia lowii]|uniref:uncharacterized oxidoreductase dhs-27-like n=1 Tax=Uranotaenia lowii TaxID=190385 RepID=UPI00247AE544|nr:uncharacterized oxidoreductase dhs-27-like [Uranotaenia lowii]
MGEETSIEVTVEENQMSEAKHVETAEEVPKNAIDSAATSTTSDGIPQYLYDAIDKLAPGEGFTPGQYKVSFETGSGKGDGFVGEMFRAYIREGDRNMTVLCKIPPRNEARRRQFGSLAIFEREVLAYSKLLPAMYEFQRERGVTEELKLGFFNAPKCYYAAHEESLEQSVVVMDDLRLEGYRMWNKLVPVNYEHVRLMMIKLGKLHAVSFALKDQRPEVFEQFKVPDPMSSIMLQIEGFQQVMLHSLDRAIALVDSGETKTLLKLQNLRENLMTDLVKMSESPGAEPYAILGHGDCWVNNMMYLYQNGAPKEMVMVDWQICRYVSPALDLVYFLFCCTDEQFRRQHYDDMIRTYYASLRELLEKLGGDATRQFPYTALLRQLRRFGRFGLIMATFVIPILCIDNADIPDLDEQAEKHKDMQEVDMSAFIPKEKADIKYRNRMGGVIRDMVKFGYL